MWMGCLRRSSLVVGLIDEDFLMKTEHYVIAGIVLWLSYVGMILFLLACGCVWAYKHILLG